MLLTFADAPEIFSNFESDCYADFAHMKLEGWNIWQICKISLFYKVLDINSEAVSFSKKNSNFRKVIPFSKNLVKSWWNSQSRNRPLFLINSADKLSKNELGLYYNNLMDPIITSGLFKRPLIMETPSNFGFLTPSVSPWHIDSRIIGVLKVFFSKARKIDKHTQNTLEGWSEDLCSAFNLFLKNKGFSNIISSNIILNILINFFYKKRAFKKFLKKVSPPVIIGSENMGTPLMAAAIEMGIPLLEFQHGAIDKYYPAYVWNKEFLSGDKIMKPSQILVFGEMAREIILKSGYFNPSEVKAIGYSKIDDFREQFADNKSFGDEPSKKILVVVQAYMHSFNLKLIDTLLKIKIEGITIYFKPHPIQPIHELETYREKLKGSAITFLDRHEKIHPLIIASDIVIGHVSTCLEEALSLSKASITLTSEQLPMGIHSMTGVTELEKAIMPSSLESLENIVETYYLNQDYRENWLSEVENKSFYIYKNYYKNNISNLW